MSYVVRTLYEILCNPSLKQMALQLWHSGVARTEGPWFNSNLGAAPFPSPPLPLPPLPLSLSLLFPSPAPPPAAKRP